MRASSAGGRADESVSIRGAATRRPRRILLDFRAVESPSGWSAPRPAVGGRTGPGALPSGGFGRSLLRILALNVAVLALYRLLFVLWFAAPDSRALLPAVLWQGFRVDSVLLAAEVGGIALVALATRWLRPAPFLAAAWAATAVNVGCAVVNLAFYRERRQHLWEMLFANVDRISQVGVAAEPFFRTHPWTFPLLVGGLFGLATVARRDARRARVSSTAGWREGRVAIGLAALVLAGLAVALERAPTKRGGADRMRWRLAASKYTMLFPDHELNQAVVNPLFDLAVYHVPAALVRGDYRLGEAEAIGRTKRILGLAGTDPRYPLLRDLHGDASLGIRNVVVVLVEGLGTTTLEDRDVDGPVMPFLVSLGARGLLFPDTWQSFSATDGSVFSVTTSLHRGFDAHAGASHFFPYEFTGSFGSLPRILGSDGLRHYFFAGFRQRIDEFVSFASNQGHRAFGYEQLVERLGDRADASGDTLGLYDHVLFELAADEILSDETPFTVQIMTGTSHSPWVVPPGHDTGALPSDLGTFRYVDAALGKFVERLRARPDFDSILFVVTGDHTSILPPGATIGARHRVPLVLWSTRLAGRRGEWVDRQGLRASHVDVLPTILGRIAGEHPFAGVGRDLLTAPVDEARPIVSSSHHESLFLEGAWALRHAPAADVTTLSPLAGGELVEVDVARDHPDVVGALLEDYFALYEASDRLARSARVFPRDRRPTVGAVSAVPEGE